MALLILASLTCCHQGVERTSSHLTDLETARLITREERPGRPSILWIEDPSEREAQEYLREFAGAGEDKNVLPPSDNNVRPLKKEKEEKDKLVNEEQALKEQRAKTELRPNEDRARRDYLAQEMLSV